MRKLLLLIAFVGAGCKDTICVGGPAYTGAGWCQKPVGQCYVSVLCPGYCLPDGGDPVDPTPYRCDGGTH
jgi:hypothetical protein